MTELVLNRSKEEALEAIKSALDNTKGISEYSTEERQVVAKTSVGFPRILWSYGEKLIIDISDSPHEDQIVIEVSAEKEIWANIGSDPEKFKRRFLNEFESVRNSPSYDVASKEVDSHQNLSNGVMRYALVAAVGIIAVSLLFTVVNLAVWTNVPNVEPVGGDSNSPISQDGDLESSDSDGFNPYASPEGETTGDNDISESNTDNVSDDTTVDYEELSPSIGCTLASYFDSNDFGDYHVGMMESEFPPGLCDDVLASNPNVNIPRYESKCDNVDIVSPIVYASEASLSESQETEYDKYQDQRVIGVVLIPDTVSADFMRCRLQTFDGKANLHIATPMTEWNETKSNLDNWGVSENTTLWAYNSSVMVSEDDYTN